MQSQRSLMTSPMRRPVMTVASQPTETSRRSHRTSPRERGGVLPQRTPPGHQRHRYQGDLWDMGDPARPHDLGLLTEDGDLEGMSAVAFSPNGRFLAASGPNEVVLWTVSDPARPQRLMAITGYSGRVNMIAFAPDGSRLATSAGENEVHMWDVGDPATPRHLTTITDPVGRIEAAAFSPDGHLLATGGNDARLWDVRLASPQEMPGLPLMRTRPQAFNLRNRQFPRSPPQIPPGIPVTSTPSSRACAAAASPCATRTPSGCPRSGTRTSTAWAATPSPPSRLQSCGRCATRTHATARTTESSDVAREGIPMRARVVACLLQLATVDLTLRRYDTDGRRSDEHRAARKPALSVQRKRRDCPARTTIPPRDLQR